MADSSFRSFRRDAPAREAEPPKRDGLSDPLAELARLIGQGGGQDGGHQTSDSYDEAAPPASEFDWASVNENDGYAANRHENGHDDRSGEPASWPLDDGYDSERAAPRPSLSPPASFNGARGQPGQNARSYAGQPPAQSRAQPFPFIPAAPDNSYRAEGSGQQHGVYASSHAGDYADDEYDDEAEPPRRGGTVVMAALLGLAVLGTAGALGYRALSNGSVIPAFPPIIKPADGPIRVKPDQQAQASNSGQADAARGSGEQVVTHQEQPVDLQSGNPIPRMIKTIPVVPNGSPDPALAGGPPPTTVAQAPVPPPGYAEPVAPPQPFGAGQAPAGVPQVPTVNRPSRVPAAPPVQRPGSNASPGPTASVPRPAPVARPKPPPKSTVVAESPSAGGPLSLVPQQEGAIQPPPAPPRAMRAATNNAAAPVSPASSAREGVAPAAGAGYVQVSSQRSEAEAQSAYRELQSKFPQQLGSRHAVIRRADLGDKGVYYRALVGPFATAEQASTFCGGLKAAGGSCFTQRN